jgi:hypothetical protein
MLQREITSVSGDDDANHKSFLISDSVTHSSISLLQLQNPIVSVINLILTYGPWLDITRYDVFYLGSKRFLGPSLVAAGPCCVPLGIYRQAKKRLGT